jgi:hypothetical protein
MKNQPNTWNELLEAGYVVELTEDQIAEFKLKTGQLDSRPFKYLTPQEAMEKSNDQEKALRGSK